jgi:aminopeptidase N
MGKKVARLYEQFQPEHYDLQLEVDPEGMTFSGTVTIRGKKTGRPSQRITLHQKDLSVVTAAITKHDKKGDQEIPVQRINTQQSFDEVRLHSEAMIYPGNYTIALDFLGTITKPMNGIYPCFYQHDGQEKKLIATQFESHHAREAFPCIDEPEAKATFDLTVTTPTEQTVLSNTPILEQSTKQNKLLTKFETTPVMSCYLLAFVFGEMDFVEAETAKGVKVRSYTTPGKAETANHSLVAAAGILDFFSDYFDVPYPLEKLDLVALPDFSVGAMENWGLVTFREQTMLADPVSSSIESRQLIALVVAHELSHQWFGNLVTMKWWDDLWLNESFANMMEYRAVDELYPEWNIWEQFVSHEEAAAKRRDSLRDVQSVKTAVNHPDEISTIFDPSIVYAKGGSLLYMLMNTVGEEAFRAGLKAYFKKHAYGNTTADDLWAALGASSGQDIATFMNGWLQRPGFPLVTVDYAPASKTANITQKRFLANPEDADSKEVWQVPLATTLDVSPSLVTSASTQLNIGQDSQKVLLLNHDGHSFFIPHYANDEHLKQIVTALAKGNFSTVDRLLLLDNYTLLQKAGHSGTTELLDILSAYKDETKESVWSALSMAIGEVRKLVEGNKPAEAKLDAMIADLSAELAEKIGWDDKPKDDAETLRLRGLLHSLAVGGKVQPIIDEGLKRFSKFKKPSDLPASTRSVIYYIGARYGTKDDFDRLMKLHDKLDSADEKEEVAGALTGAKETARYRPLIAKLTDSSIRRQDLLHWFIWLLRNRYSRTETWQWMKDNWDWIVEEMGSDKNFSYFARYAGSIFSRQAEYDDYVKFFEPKKSIVALQRDVMLAEQEMQSHLKWRERNEQSVIDWLKNYKT